VKRISELGKALAVISYSPEDGILLNDPPSARYPDGIYGTPTQYTMGREDN
jgi:hypothetical protein